MIYDPIYVGVSLPVSLGSSTPPPSHYSFYTSSIYLQYSTAYTLHLQPTRHYTTLPQYWVSYTSSSQVFSLTVLTANNWLTLNAYLT